MMLTEQYIPRCYGSSISGGYLSATVAIGCIGATMKKLRPKLNPSLQPRQFALRRIDIQLPLPHSTTLTIYSISSTVD